MPIQPVTPVFSLIASGRPSTINANGNSGAYAFGSISKALDVRNICDLLLTVSIGNAPTGTTPTLTVQVNLFDDQGNLYTPAALTTAALTAAGVTALSAGLHGGSASAYLVVPNWAQVSWVVGGTTPSFTAVEISLNGR